MNIPSETTAAAELGAETERRAPIPWLERLNDMVGRAVEFPAAALVVIEVGVLLAGVIWRYALHHPLIWSDELASILFVWLAMLGSVIALRRGEHMRMTALVGMMGPRARAMLDLLAIAATLTFLVLIVGPAFVFAEEEIWVVTPALGIANTWRAAALPVGFTLMIVTGFIQLFRVGTTRDALISLGVMAVLVVVFLALSPVLMPLDNWNLLIFFSSASAPWCCSACRSPFPSRSPPSPIWPSPPIRRPWSSPGGWTRA